MRRPATRARAAEDNLRNYEPGLRDEAVREAALAGVSLARIQSITGLGVTTIQRIMNKPIRPRGTRP